MKLYYNIIPIILLISVIVMGLASAEVQSLPSVKQNDCIELPQSHVNATSINVTKIRYPTGSEDYTVRRMSTTNNVNYNYTFCGTSSIGKYLATTVGDGDGVLIQVDYEFEVTPSGFIDTLGFYFVLLIIIGSVIWLGIKIEDAWFVIIGGLASMMLGLYSINYGITGFRDMFMTWGIGLFEIAVGSILALNGAMHKIDSE